MDGVLHHVLESMEGRLLVPVVLAMLIMLGMKAVSGMQHSRSSARREFLELFQAMQSKDDLWLSVAVRHQFGVYLPPALIRQLLKGPQPARAVMEISEAWDLVDLDDTTGSLVWRHPHMHGTPRRRRIYSVVLAVLSFITLFIALTAVSVLLNLDSGPLVTVVSWSVCAEMLLFGCWWMYKAGQLPESATALKRWLDMH